jgi:hypothetical protein
MGDPAWSSRKISASAEDSRAAYDIETLRNLTCAELQMCNNADLQKVRA